MTPEKIDKRTLETPYSTGERQQALKNIAQRRRELEVQRSAIEAELVAIEAVELGHLAALKRCLSQTN